MSVTTQSINAIPIVGYNVARVSSGSSNAIVNPTSTSTSLPSSSSTLSPGVSAGIGVGAALGVVAVAGLIFFLMRRKRPSQPQPVKYEAAPVQASSPAYAASTPVHEMHQSAPKHNYYNTPVELQGR